MFDFKHPRRGEIMSRLHAGQSVARIAKELRIGERVVRTARQSVEMKPRTRWDKHAVRAVVSLADRLRARLLELFS